MQYSSEHPLHILRGYRLECSNYILFLLLKHMFIMVNSEDPDEMLLLQHLMWVYTVCQWAPLTGFQYQKGKKYPP